MCMCAVRTFREAGSVRCAIVVDPFRVTRTYVVSAGAGRCRLAADKALAAVLAHLAGRKALIARFAEMLSVGRLAADNASQIGIVFRFFFDFGRNKSVYGFFAIAFPIG